MYENVWTGERVGDRPKETAGQGKINYGRSREELEKINVRFAGIDMSGSRRKGKNGGKGSKGKEVRGRKSADPPSPPPFRPPTPHSPLPLIPPHPSPPTSSPTAPPIQ
jgi:hypothetical protein